MLFIDMATSSQQKQELFKAIWATAEDLRNSVDGWDFKSYVLGKCRNEKHLNLYQAQDDVDEKKETLLAKVETMLTQKIEQTKLITFHWRIV